MSRVLYLCLWGILAVQLAGCGSLSKPPLRTPKEEAAYTDPSPALHRKASAAQDSAATIAAHAHYALGVIHELNGETEASLKEFYQAAWDDPSNEWLLLEVSRRFIHERQMDKAVELLSRAAAQPDVSGQVLARLSMVYSQLGKATESQAAAYAAIKKVPATLAAYQSLFVTALQAKQQHEALAALDLAAKVSKPTPEFLMGLSELYVTYGMQTPAEKDDANAKALALLERARKLDVSQSVFKLKLADGFSLLGQTDTAAELYQQLLTTPSSSLQENVHAKLANIYLRSSNKARAVEQLKALIRADPTNPQPYYFLGHLAFDEQKIPEAADYFSKTLLLSPDFEQAYYELANTQLAMDKPSEALETLEKARGKFAAGFSMEFFSAVACARLKDYDSALRHFTAAEIIANTTNPKRLNHIFYFQLGVAYEQKKDYSQAAKAFEKSLELSPDFTEAMNYLGYMWADLGTNLGKAVTLLEKAVKAEPKSAAFLDSLGWAYFKLDRFEEALTQISKAVQLSEEPDPTLLDHLGDVYAALGRNKEAREAWDKSFKLEGKTSVKAKLDASNKE